MLTFIDAANQFRQLGIDAAIAQKAAEAHRLFEMAFTSAMMGGESGMPIHFSLLNRDHLPRPLISIEHVLVRISGKALIFIADFELAMQPVTEFTRFPMVAAFFAGIARSLPEGISVEVVVDLGDGDDRGDYPRVAYSSTRADAVLVPDPFFHMAENYVLVREFAATQARPWRERKDVFLWRGTAGGRPLAPLPQGDFDIHCSDNWRWVQRLQFCSVSRNSAHRDKLDVGLTGFHQVEQQPLREKLVAADFVRPEMIKERFFDYQYLFDIDGWTNSWSLLDKLIMGAVILKVASPQGYRQWYYDRLLPWTHFIPIAADLSYFDDKIAWALAHPQDCEAMAAHAAQLAETIQLETELRDAAERVKAILTLAG